MEAAVEGVVVRGGAGRVTGERVREARARVGECDGVVLVCRGALAVVVGVVVAVLVQPAAIDTARLAISAVP